MRKAALCLAILLAAACVKSGSVWLEMRNASDEPLRDVTLDYTRGSFEHPFFRPGLTYGRWVRVVKTQPLVLTYTNRSGGRRIPLQSLTQDMITGGFLITVRGDGQVEESFTPWSGYGPNGNDWLEDHYHWVAGAIALLLLPVFLQPLLTRLAGAARRLEAGRERVPSNPVLEEAAARLGMSRAACPVLYHPESDKQVMWWQGKANGHTIGLLDDGMIWIGEAGEETLCLFERSAPGGPFTIREFGTRAQNPVINDHAAARLVSELSSTVRSVSILGDAVEAAAAWGGAKADSILADIRVLSSLKTRLEELDPPLVRAVMRGRETAALAMIKTTANFEELTIGGLNAMTSAAAAGRTELVKALLAAGARAQPEHGFPLHAAARAGHAETVTALLDGGAPLNGRDERQNTPLMGAAAAGHQEIVELLLAKGADLQARDTEQGTALSHAEAEGFTLVAAALRAAGARR